MKKKSTEIVIGLFALCVLTLVSLGMIAKPNRLAHDQEDSAAAMLASGLPNHHHGQVLSLSPGPTTPTLDIAVVQDPISGWNLHIETTNFRFSPEKASGPHRAGEGHAHVYVNGRKLARVYGPWFHIDELPQGTNDVTVTLNSNDHKLLAVGEAPLKLTRPVTVE